MIRSAVAKLTLWYLAIILVLGLLFSLALYRESSAQLYENAEHQRDAISRLPLPGIFEPRRDAFIQNLSNQLDQDRHRLLLRLLVLNLATMVVGGAAAYALARRTLRPIQDSLEAQGRFTADASHELRTPLTAMRSEIEVALRQKQLPAEEARQLLGSNLEEIAKLEALSAGLLRLARSENGLDPAAITHVPVRELFAAAIDRHAKAMHERQITVEHTAGPETVAGDRDSLLELIAILLDNAIKYSPPGSTVALTSELAGTTVKLAVADHGVGIKPAELAHIFDRFYRADRSRTKEHVGGYGLGLSIAKRVVDLHHGTIAADSTPEKGTTFRIKLPSHYTPKTSLF